jgi:hypothetical protein
MLSSDQLVRLSKQTKVWADRRPPLQYRRPSGNARALEGWELGDICAALKRWDDQMAKIGGYKKLDVHQLIEMIPGLHEIAALGDFSRKDYKASELLNADMGIWRSQHLGVTWESGGRAVSLALRDAVNICHKHLGQTAPELAPSEALVLKAKDIDDIRRV